MLAKREHTAQGVRVRRVGMAPLQWTLMSWTPTSRVIDVAVVATSRENAARCNRVAVNATAANVAVAVAVEDPPAVDVATRSVSRFVPRRRETREISRGGPPY